MKQVREVENLSIDQVETLKAIFVDLRQGNISHLDYGICGNAYRHKLNPTLDSGFWGTDGLLDTYALVPELAGDWKHNVEPPTLQEDGSYIYSAFPIEDVPRLNKRENDNWRWKGNQLKLRNDLLDHMIYRLDKILGGEK